MEAKYGSGFYKMLSKDLKELMPEVHSFSVSNLKYMRYFYEAFPDDATNRQQVVDDLNIVFCIPWGHMVLLLGKFRNNPQKMRRCGHSYRSHLLQFSPLRDLWECSYKKSQGTYPLTHILTITGSCQNYGIQYNFRDSELSGKPEVLLLYNVLISFYRQVLFTTAAYACFLRGIRI
jgi:hypothetical protein